MSYVRPDILIKNRLRDRSPPDWKLAVVSFRDRKGSDGLARAFRAEPVAHTIFYGQEAFAESPFVYETSLDGNKIGVITRCIWGGPYTAILVEELAQLGVKFLIGYGSAGSIDASLKLGQQVVVASAIPNDGTSRAYGQIEKIEVGPDLKNLAVRAGALAGCNLEFVTAATVDAFYRETRNAVSEWRQKGAQIINIEASPFYVVSRSCGIKSVGVGHVSDRLMDEWENWWWNRDQATHVSEKLCMELSRLVICNHT